MWLVAGKSLFMQQSCAHVAMEAWIWVHWDGSMKMGAFGLKCDASKAVLVLF